MESPRPVPPVSRERLHGPELDAERLGSLLGADRGTREHRELARQPLQQPLGHALGLLAALGRERALEVRAAFFRFRVPPEDQVHGSGSIKFSLLQAGA